MKLRTATFRSDELEPVDVSECVVLGSGGPLMKVLSVADDQALCQWGDHDEKTATFPVACLRSLVPFVPSNEKRS